MWHCFSEVKRGRFAVLTEKDEFSCSRSSAGLHVPGCIAPYLFHNCLRCISSAVYFGLKKSALLSESSKTLGNEKKFCFWGQKSKQKCPVVLPQHYLHHCMCQMMALVLEEQENSDFSSKIVGFILYGTININIILNAFNISKWIL